MSDYSTRTQNKNVDIVHALSELEKNLLDKFCKVNVTGKRG